MLHRVNEFDFYFYFCIESVNGKKCKGTLFTHIEGSRLCQDYQEVKIQEQVQRLTMGSIPRAILAVLKDDLVDQYVYSRTRTHLYDIIFNPYYTILTPSDAWPVMMW
jgi:DNA replicative helicase MCM subunit Mcm2 (Cdc46/Mcm family)